MSHDHFMRLALGEAAKALDAGEVPVGAILVRDGAIIGTGWNRPIGTADPTAHAEVVALRSGAARIGNYRLTGATLYVTIEPCLMCVGALVHARVGTVIYGATEPKAGAIESMTDAHALPRLNHRFDVIGGVLATECSALMQRFFSERRAAPDGGFGMVVGHYAVRNDDVDIFETVLTSLAAVAGTDALLGDEPLPKVMMSAAMAVLRLAYNLRAQGALLDNDALRLLTILRANVRGSADPGLTADDILAVVQRTTPGADRAWVDGQLERLLKWPVAVGEPKALVAAVGGRWRPLA